MKENPSPQANLPVDKAISAEPGNPYGAFLTAAQSDFGKTPEDIYINKLQLSVAADSPVQKLGDIFSGPCAINFIIDGSGNTHTIGTATVAAATTATLDATRGNQAPWPKADITALTAGSFKVALNCSAPQLHLPGQTN